MLLSLNYRFDNLKMLSTLDLRDILDLRDPLIYNLWMREEICYYPHVSG